MVVSATKIRDHIINHLKWDASLKGSDIKVDYVDRIAILSGTVPSLQAHESAQRDALDIPGVDRVESRLVVKFDHDHPNKSDKELQGDISKILSCTVDAGMNRIRVAVQDGIVNLTGTTDAFWKRSRIEDLVSSVDGVLDIDNEIKVTPSDKAPDLSIKKEIMQALERMEVDGVDNLDVQVKEGVVTLKGSVPTWDTYLDVDYTARFTTGVVDVKNKIAVD